MERLDPIEALRFLPHPLVIVTAGNVDRGEYNGMTAAWVSRVSWDPPLVMVSISPKRYTWTLVNKYRMFAINIIPKQLVDKALNIFGRLSGKETDKFKAAGLRVEKGRRLPVPIITESILVLECTVENIVEAGDHYIVVGRVIEAYRLSQDKPLIYLRGEVYGIGEKIA